MYPALAPAVLTDLVIVSWSPLPIVDEATRDQTKNRSTVPTVVVAINVQSEDALSIPVAAVVALAYPTMTANWYGCTPSGHAGVNGVFPLVFDPWPAAKNQGAVEAIWPYPPYPTATLTVTVVLDTNET